MDLEKRKRKADGNTNGKRSKSREENGGGVKKTAPPDEEVDEFFAIMKRIQVAIKYFQDRDGRELTAATPWNPSFKREDFDGVKKDPKASDGKSYPGLDLNSDPAPEEKPDLLSGSV